MALVRAIEIENFRSIQKLRWCPSNGVNCLIGPGDSGKTTIIDAIDYCVGAKRTLVFNDADFHDLKVENPIKITVTLGALDESLMNFDLYGFYLRGYDANSKEIHPEPQAGMETVLSVMLTVEADLEPQWTLFSERAAAQGLTRGLGWSDRVRLAPTRLGAFAENQLSWRKGSILSKLSEEEVDTSSALTEAGRQARATFGKQANEQLKDALEVVAETAKALGVPVGAGVNALLDVASVSLRGAMVSLHDADGVPLAGLGLGSKRLLIAGLQREAADQASIILVDELEHGLEPHRIIRLLGALGAKEEAPPLQVFVTTHSPVVVRELSGTQLNVVRNEGAQHVIVNVGNSDEVQGAVRRYPDALLSSSIVVGEGASEVGLLRGIDLNRVENGKKSLLAQGASLVDGGGDTVFKRANAFQSLGYRVAVVRDDDVQPTPDLEQSFLAAGGVVFKWQAGRSLEDELFLSLSDSAVQALLEHAIELKGEALINDHIKSASSNAKDLEGIRLEAVLHGIPADSRAILGKAARPREERRCWFKSVTAMEDVGREIVAPDMPNAAASFSSSIEDIFAWIDNGDG